VSPQGRRDRTFCSDKVDWDPVEQMVVGFPDYGVRWDRRVDFAAWAGACGRLGMDVENPGELKQAVVGSYPDPGPALVEVVLSADEPPMPAKVHYDQSNGFAKTFLSPEPRRGAVQQRCSGPNSTGSNMRFH